MWTSPIISSTPTAEMTAPSESRSYQMGTTSMSLTDMELCSVWETTGRGCRVETVVSQLWPSSSPESAPLISLLTLDCKSLTSRDRVQPKQRNLWTQWTRLESSLRSFTVPASTRDETAALRHQDMSVFWCVLLCPRPETMHSFLHVKNQGLTATLFQHCPIRHDLTKYKCSVLQQCGQSLVLSRMFHPVIFSDQTNSHSVLVPPSDTPGGCVWHNGVFRVKRRWQHQKASMSQEQHPQRVEKGKVCLILGAVTSDILYVLTVCHWIQSLSDFPGCIWTEQESQGTRPQWAEEEKQNFAVCRWGSCLENGIVS